MRLMMYWEVYSTVVVNILQDGKEVADMSTVVVPINDSTVRAYELIAGSVKK